ncbi:prolyl oligopeptidase family serine peptidase [Pedobacter sp. BS3]|uniref:alpha/beta hydrolase family protein n=1 Tax=Pedobacter sp. BS3 TaxID=2567937 RepID=UPI0011F0516B|nr:prolyl oligopeptidase family serine peptidase [Pedobacter sp. BS3]TZF81081.1 prolyl oligopeptidase family serine peptidase [Pedobacter sp. BS3]
MSRRSYPVIKGFCLLLICLGCIYQAAAQPVITGEKQSAWHQFTRTEFKLNGIPAWIITPRKPLPGKPWVWRAHFPNWHTQVDSMLLGKGFYVAYINANNLYGCPKALSVWDDFYRYLTGEKGFAAKVALEGVSRGGLYVYGWAKRHPEKVSCIYAEAPVCDFKSWPAGKGKSKGSANDWKKLLQAYGFTEEQALNYTNQPKDNLEALAAYKVPVLHAISLTDSIVPYAENTAVLINNYIQKGGPATVIPMTTGKRELDGHHFPIENPEVIAGFIYRNSVPVVSLSRETH